eukprot:757735-Rhodomonas_salina.1
MMPTRRQPEGLPEHGAGMVIPGGRARSTCRSGSGLPSTGRSSCCTASTASRPSPTPSAPPWRTR